MLALKCVYGTDIITMRGEAEVLYICLDIISDVPLQARHLNWKLVFSDELTTDPPHQLHRAGYDLIVPCDRRLSSRHCMCSQVE